MNTFRLDLSRTTTIVSIFLISCSIFFRHLSAAQTKKCGNEDCDEILFRGKVHKAQPNRHPNFLAYDVGDVIKVYAIELNDRVDLWEGELEDGTRGLFYKNHIDHDEYVNFLEKYVTENHDLFVMEREKRLGSSVTKEKAADTLARVWKVAQEKTKGPSASSENSAAAPQQNQVTTPEPVAATTQPPKDLHSLLKHEHHDHGGHGHGHSHDHNHNHNHDNHNHNNNNNVKPVEAVAKENQQTSTPPPAAVTQNAQQPVVENVNNNQRETPPPVQNVAADSVKPPGQNTATNSVNQPKPTVATESAKPQPTADVAKQQPPVTPEQVQQQQNDAKVVKQQTEKVVANQVEQPQLKVVRQVKNVEPVPAPNVVVEQHVQQQQEQVVTQQTPSVSELPPPTQPPVTPVVTEPVKVPVEIKSDQVVQQDQSTKVPVITPTQPVQQQEQQQHHIEATHKEPEVPVVQVKVDDPAPATTLPEPPVFDTTSDQVVNAVTQPPVAMEVEVPPPATNTESSYTPVVSPVAEPAGVIIEGVESQVNPIAQDTQGSAESIPKPEEPTPPSKNEYHQPLEIDKVLESLEDEINTTAIDDKKIVEDLEQQPEVAKTSPVAKGTEITNELGDQFCIKEDCNPANGLGKHVHHDEHDHHDIHEHHDHNHIQKEPPAVGDQQQEQKIEKETQIQGHGHSHDHADEHGHGHSHEHGHGHSHSHQPTVGEKIKDAAKTGKSYAVWIKQNLKPFVTAFRFVLKPLHRLVPREFQDFIGERELFMIVVVFLTLLAHFVNVFLDGGRRRRTMINLCKYAELFEKYKVLETENDKLKKNVVDSDKFSVEAQKERELKEAKAAALQKLSDENHALKESIGFLEAEIERLKQKLSQSVDQEKETRQFQKKFDDLQSQNQALDRQTAEYRASFEREREKVDVLETKLTTEKENLKKVEKENQKMKNDAKETAAKFSDAEKKLKEISSDLDEKNKELDGLKQILANLDENSAGKINQSATDSNGRDWDWGDSDEEAKKHKMEAKMAEIVNAAKLQSELQQQRTEMEQLRKLMKQMIDEKETAEKNLQTSKVENEQLQKSLNDANEKTLTLTSKINVLRDFYEDQRKEMSKQITQQQVLSQKQTNDLGSFEEESKRIREENAILRKTDDDLRSEVKTLDNLLSKARNELDRCRHEAWTSVRKLEREKDALKSDNSMLRTRLAERVDKGRSPADAGDVSNNSSEAELGAITQTSPLGLPMGLPSMPSYPPPPNVFSGHTSPFYPLPPGPPFGGGPYYPREEYSGYYSPLESPRDEYPPEYRRSGRRQKSKARSNPSRSPSPPKDRDHRRARSRGNGGREPSVSPPPQPRRAPRNRP